MVDMDDMPALVPIRKVIKADRIRPKGRKNLALLRSDTPPIKNLENPYAIALAERASPRSPLSNPISTK